MSPEDAQPDPPEAGRGRKAFLLRLPPELLAELKRWAAAEVRSVNGHVEYLLRDAVRRHRRERAPDGDADDEAPRSP